MKAAPPDRRAIITEALRKIDHLTKRLEIAEKGDTEPIAVIGMGCRFPGGVNNPVDYWQLLQDGVSGVGRVPKDRWDADAYYSEDHTTPGTICTTDGGFLTSWQPGQFDAEFFSIAPREAAAMDPQQRLLLEVAWEALENAGITPQVIRGTQTSVFVGLTTNDYSLTFAGRLRPEDVDPYIPFGNASNFAAGRLAYFLGVHGPALVIDTACSSSLVAIHLACQSLRRRESDNAVAAGVNLILSPENSIACSRWGMLAPDGRCKTFDADADGYVRSEGCGVVVLKRLSDALRDGDPVLAVVRGSAVNQDGPSSGQTVPSGPAQQALLRQALATSRLQPSDIDYIEAHGTGTALGDPIELDALGQVFSQRDGSTPLVLGSVKTNLGHLESAAGIAGFIKTVLSVRNGYIPKHLNFERLTPHAGDEASAFTVASQPMQWPTVERARRAGVSSFGVSGTNAHVVVEQAPAPDPVEPQPDPAVSTLVVSAKTPERIASTASGLAEWMAGAGAQVRLADVAHTLNHHRAHHGKFATVAARDREQAVAGLRAIAEGYPAPGVVGPHEGLCRPGTVFVYSGQGSQWAGMGRQLLADEPAFAAAVAELEPDFVEQVGFSLQQVLTSGEPVTGIDRIQPVLVGMQLALTALWRSYGVRPDAVIGHSMGEVAAAVVAGALTAAEGLRVIATRSRLMSRLSGQGAMALLELDASAAEELIAAYPGVTVAVYASPRQTVIAGPPEQVDAVIAVVDAQDRLARRIEVDVASHHPIIDPVLPELRTALADLSPQPPTIPVFTTTGNQEPDGTTLFDAEYWAVNLRKPVRFSQAVAAAGVDHATFVEISPHPLLGYAIGDTLAGVHHHSIATLQRDTHDTLTFHTNLNATHITQPPRTPHPAGPHPAIPNTPWHHAHHWIALPEPPEIERHNGVQLRTAAAATGVPAEWFYELTWPVRELPALGTSSDSSWLVLGDPEVGTELEHLLGADSRVAVLAPSVLDHEGDDAALLNALIGAENVLYAPSGASAQPDITAAYRLFNAVRRLAATLVAAASPRKLFIVTRNAQPTDDGNRANPSHAILWGLGRTLALEHPEIWGGIVDVDDSVPPELIAHYVLAEVGAGDGEDQVVYQAGRRRVPRLQQRLPRSAAPATLRADTSHLVIGATGNIGPALIRQLSEMGAGTIVAVSRHAGSRLDDLAAALASNGTTLIEVAADAADEAAMTELFARFGTELPPLDGIYVAALAGGPVLLRDMTDDDVHRMFRPKVDVVSVLHKLTLKTPVRHFVLFSSITGLIGSRWLGHYTATGAFLDAFAYARRALGLSATVVDWGLWKVADDQQSTSDAGLQPMPDEVAIRALPAVIGADSAVQCAVVGADWNLLAAAYRMRGALRVVDDVLCDESADEPAEIHLGQHTQRWITLTNQVEAAGSAPLPGTLLGEHIEVSAEPGAHVWRAQLAPEAKPYPGGHRVQGVEVVPASVLLHTLSVAAAERGASTLRDVRFEYPIVVDQPRVIQVVLEEQAEHVDGCVTVASAPTADTPAHRWIRHVSGRIADGVPDDERQCANASGANEITAYNSSSAVELQRAWGIEGQPFPWSVGSSRSVPGGLKAYVGVPDASTAALLDAAIHVARLADTSNLKLMFPAGVETVRFNAELTDELGSVEVRRCGGGDDELIVDIALKGPHGGVCVDIRGLRYAAAESSFAEPALTDDEPAASVAWSEMSAENILSELEIRLQALLARELGMPPAAVDLDRPFPELGLDSMMAMTVLRDAKQLSGIDLSATMLWNHPTISSLASFLTEMLEPQANSEEHSAEALPDSANSLLDALFDSVESATAGSESGI